MRRALLLLAVSCNLDSKLPAPDAPSDAPPAGRVQFARSFGDSGTDEAYFVKLRGGEIQLAGILEGVVGFGDTTLTSAGLADGFVATFDADGTPQGARAIPATGADFVSSFAIDSSGNQYVVGSFDGTLTVGGTTLVSSQPQGVGFSDGFLLKLSAGGAVLGSRTWGGARNQDGLSVLIDPAGDIIIVGNFHDTIDLGGTPLVATGSSLDTFVAKFSPSGTHLWSKRFGGDGDELAYGVLDAAGNIIVAGRFAGPANFGGDDFTPVSTDVFLLKLDSEGQHVFSKQFGGNGLDNFPTLATTPAREIYLATNFGDVVTLPGGTVLTPVGDRDLAVIKLDAAGDIIWSTMMGGPGFDNVDNIALDPAGNVYLTGYFSDTATICGTSMTTTGDIDLFVCKLTADADPVWVLPLAGTGRDEPYALDVDATKVVVAGYFESPTLTIEDAVLTSAGGRDIFMIGLDP